SAAPAPALNLLAAPTFPLPVIAVADVATASPERGEVGVHNEAHAERGELPMRIVVVGTGYVGLANAVVLAQRHQVVALDIDADKVAQVNARQSPIVDPELSEMLATAELDLEATTDPAAAYSGADWIVVATPTDYDTETNYFDTSTVESVLDDVQRHVPGATVVIKSTIPVG